MPFFFGFLRRRCLQHYLGRLDLLSFDELWSIMGYRVGVIRLYVHGLLLSSSEPRMFIDWGF